MKILAVTERTKFVETRRNPNGSITQYVHRLKEASKYCEFKTLGTKDMINEEELILFGLIKGTLDTSHYKSIWHKIFTTRID